MVWAMATTWMTGGRRGGNRKLVPPVGPLLWTLERLCVDSIDPSRDVAARLLSNCMCEDDAYDEGFSKSI